MNIFLSFNKGQAVAVGLAWLPVECEKWKIFVVRGTSILHVCNKRLRVAGLYS